MGSVVVDASVVAKWFVPEEHHRQAREVRDEYVAGTHDLTAPALMPFEVANALKYSGQYDGDRLTDAVDALSNYGVDLLPFGDVGPLADVAQATDVTVYDAAYVAAATRTGGTLYTADSRLLDSLAGTDYADVAHHVRTYGD